MNMNNNEGLGKKADTDGRMDGRLTDEWRTDGCFLAKCNLRVLSAFYPFGITKFQITRITKNISPFYRKG